MRITSELFVSQLTRRVFADGGYASILRKGADAAGAIFIVSRSRDGVLRLYGQVAQALAAADGTRMFAAEDAADDAALASKFAREARFDPDFWVVEIEIDRPETYLDMQNARDDEVKAPGQDFFR